MNGTEKILNVKMERTKLHIETRPVGKTHVYIMHIHKKLSQHPVDMISGNFCFLAYIF